MVTTVAMRTLHNTTLYSYMFPYLCNREVTCVHIFQVTKNTPERTIVTV